ncbi:MAG TPA: hypothetical protein VFS33_10505 [Gemmatimonadales bacterium]|nr:hypothetical protein [Gemmatimonadales bacterium]
MSDETMTDDERAHWTRVQTDYSRAFKIASKVWPQQTPPDVIQAATATLLIHHKDLQRRNGAASNGAQTGTSDQSAAKGPQGFSEVEACPQCGGAVYDNRAKNRERKANGQKPLPVFKCKDEDGCGWKQWPPKGGK